MCVRVRLCAREVRVRVCVRVCVYSPLMLHTGERHTRRVAPAAATSIGRRRHRVQMIWCVRACVFMTTSVYVCMMGVCVRVRMCAFVRHVCVCVTCE